MAYSKKTRIFLVIFLIIGWAITLFYVSKPSRKLYKDNRVLMGTFWEVSSPNKNAARIVFKEVERIENLLSKYRKTSEISRLNESGRQNVSPETFKLIAKSAEISRKTEGAFDITVGPLIDLWGFTNRQFKVPGPDEIKEALKLVGNDKIVFHKNGYLIEFKQQGMKLDLGGIAKGYALDCAIKKLKEKKIQSCLINAGGQVYALGDRLGKSWKVAVRDPRSTKVTKIILLKNQSVSTSGDYEQFFLKNNKRYGHIINPKTGYPADSGLETVSVICDSATYADALSTAIFILGKEKQKEILSKFPEIKAEIF